jgi:hypothetical protein
MSRTDTQLKFRIPPDLKPRLEKAALANKRSMNMEVIARLERSFAAPDPSDAKSKAAAAKLLRMGLLGEGDPLAARITKLEHEVKEIKSRLTKKKG